MGVAVDPGQMIDLIEAMQHVEIGREEDLRSACQVVLLRRREDLPLFEQAWAFWWSTRRSGGVSDVKLPESPAKVTRLPRRLMRHRDAQSEGCEREERDELEIQLSYSPSEALREKDFADFDADEMDEARVLLTLLRPRIKQCVTRRGLPGCGHRIDCAAPCAGRCAREARRWCSRGASASSASDRSSSSVTSAARWTATGASCSSSSMPSPWAAGCRNLSLRHPPDAHHAAVTQP